MKLITQDEFIEKVKSIYGDRFDFSQTVYVNSRRCVDVICPRHGKFTVLGSYALSGHCTCPDCKKEPHKKYATEEIVTKLKEKYGDYYDYSQVEYKGSHVDITIICPKHGPFKIKPSAALGANKKNLCRKCFFERISDLYTSTTEDFIKKARKIHGDKYDYSKAEYVKSNQKVCIICPVHGEFWQTPTLHLGGEGCKKCRDESISLGKETFIERSRAKFGDRFDYSKVEYVNARTPVCLIDKITGVEFWQAPCNHLVNHLPRACRKAEQDAKPKQQKESKRKYLSTEIVITRLQELFGNKYDYSKVVYTNAKEPITIICPIHGEFKKKADKSFLGQGCPECAKLGRAQKRSSSTDEFIEKARAIHGDKYDYSKVEYVKAIEKVCIICPKHGEFWQTPNKHLTGQGCEKCTTPISKWETEVHDFIVSLGVKTKPSDKSIMPKQLEIDIMLPDLNIGVECDGLWWHCEEFKKPDTHLVKTDMCHEKGIRLIHIFEDEWYDRCDIVKSMLRYICGKTDKKIHARKCEIHEVPTSEAKAFLNENHIQGPCLHETALGLYYMGELVSLMTFGKERVNLGSKYTEDGKKELLRFCNKLNTAVVGAAQKLFKYYTQNFSYSSIKSFCDRRWFTGEIYERLGFTLDHVSQPNYYYIVHNRRENRFKYRKDRLVAEGFDPNKTEREIMKERNIRRIYDCGNKVYYFYNNALLQNTEI